MRPGTRQIVGGNAIVAAIFLASGSMKLLVSLSAVSLVAMASAASAAGPAAAAEASSWSGFYIGTDLAFTMSATELVVDGIVDWNGAGARGASVGVFAGYNYQFDKDWVGGLEFGGAVSSIRGHTEVNTGGNEINTETSTDWNVGVSGRLGRLVNPQTLIFASLGAKIYHGAGRFWQPSDPASGIYEDDTFFGLASIGLGVEIDLDNNLRFRAEYDADLLQATQYGSLTVTPFLGTVKASLIYAVGDIVPVGVAESGAQIDWSGFYAGILGGQSVGVAALNFDSGPDFIHHDGLGSSGWTGGVVGGYNYQVNDKLVLGLETGVSLSTLASHQSFGSGPGEVELRGENRWWVNARVRAGYLASPQTMIYGFTGLSHTHSTLSLLEGGAVLGDPLTYDRTGVEFGGGVEAALDSNVTLRAEYGYTMLASTDIDPLSPGFGSMNQVQQTASVGLIFHLND